VYVSSDRSSPVCDIVFVASLASSVFVRLVAVRVDASSATSLLGAFCIEVGFRGSVVLDRA
jgi:hypothetical protein